MKNEPPQQNVTPFTLEHWLNDSQFHDTMPFGKFQGQPVETVPTWYLLWVLKTCDIEPGLRKRIQGVLSCRAAGTTVVQRTT